MTSAARLTSALSDRYRLERELGQGGMATVYLAEDLKHGRKVAIKVLLPELSAVIGGERFLAEIKTTAQLQHPHILGLIDSGEVDGLLYYVMPFVEGESLRTRLVREKQLPVADALRLTQEVASALEFAHRRGIVHRDIKPENILLQDGQALVADFGIALAVQQAGGSRMTQTGMSLGTPAYMSPEQAMGEREIGARSDVYALGAMAYEMLAGEPPFTGPNSQAIVAKVLTENPPPLRTRRPLVPVAVEAAVLSALQKLPADRFGSAREFADAIGDARTAGRQDGTHPATVALPAAQRPLPSWRRAVVPSLLVLAAVSTVAAVFLALRPRTAAQLPARYQLNLPGLQRNNLRYSGGSFSVSRDGRRVAYVRTNRIGERSLWVLEQPEGVPREIGGTDGVDAMFFSPDGNSVAYFSGGKLFRVPFAGGKPVPLADSMSLDLASGVWREDGMLLVNGAAYDLRMVPENGGTTTVIAKPSAAGVEGLVFPTLLPDADRLLVTLCSANCGRMTLSTLDLTTRKLVELVPGASRSWFLAPNRLLYVMQDGAVMLADFDPKAGTIRGTPRQVVGGVRLNLSIAPQIDVAADGRVILFAGGDNTGSQRQVRIVRVDRDGRSTPIDTTWEGVFNYSALSPDASRLAITVIRDQRQDLWVKQLDRGPITRLTFEGAVNYRPFWLPGGRELLFLSDQSGLTLPYTVRADGSGKPERFAVPDTAQIDEIEQAPGGQWIVYRRGTVNGVRRLAMFRPGVDSTPTEVSVGRFDEYSPTVSPDGRWLAYVSVESGREEVYVRPFPDVARARWQASTSGGSSPVWSRDGRELYFAAAAGHLASLDIAPGPEFRPSALKNLFSLAPYLLGPYHQSFVVEPGGRTFHFAQAVDMSASEEYTTVLLDWLGG
jgi:eukaryotic-like serine/threonine-protein kinase